MRRFLFACEFQTKACMRSANCEWSGNEPLGTLFNSYEIMCIILRYLQNYWYHFRHFVELWRILVLRKLRRSVQITGNTRCLKNFSTFDKIPKIAKCWMDIWLRNPSPRILNEFLTQESCYSGYQSLKNKKRRMVTNFGVTTFAGWVAEWFLQSSSGDWS